MYAHKTGTYAHMINIEAASGVLSQDRNGMQLAGLDTSTEACGLIR